VTQAISPLPVQFLAASAVAPTTTSQAQVAVLFPRRAVAAALRRLGVSRMAPPAAAPLGVDTLNKRVLAAEYAVRGEIVRRAQDISRELKSGSHSYPFEKIVYCNIGNPQILGQKPITYFRQVLSLCEYPEVGGLSGCRASTPAPAPAGRRCGCRAGPAAAPLAARRRPRWLGRWRRPAAALLSAAGCGCSSVVGDIGGGDGAPRSGSTSGAAAAAALPGLQPACALAPAASPRRPPPCPPPCPHPAPPQLLDSPLLPQLFPADVIARARELLRAVPGGIGAYSESAGVPYLRRLVAQAIERRCAGARGGGCGWQLAALAAAGSAGVGSAGAGGQRCACAAARAPHRLPTGLAPLRAAGTASPPAPMTCT
jgi:hypothetical protein